ncbi:hypothetical protein ACIPJS_14785 [Streptomyces sp. NPDC086783]|uniref:hypothetical protein n=1 Tax=Streptomyces sp. NPDC086783 TaxID=3365758 RepID=UPI00381AAEBB
MTTLDAVRQLRDASPDVTGRPRVTAIDGRSGAGKTTLAERLREVVPNSAVVHTDDIAWNHAYFDILPDRGEILRRSPVRAAVLSGVRRPGTPGRRPPARSASRENVGAGGVGAEPSSPPG